MKTLIKIPDLRALVLEQKRHERTVAFVPTMGALHEGHASCIEIARELGEFLVVSIFVNPTQFGPGEDLDNYPSTVQRDISKCDEWGCDVVFAPSVAEIYPVDQSTWVSPQGMSEALCGKTRPGHFRGVATVVLKLFNIVQPDVAVFGQKDAQQALIIRDLIRQLNLPVDIRLSPVVREADGLACSSRNAYLSAEERKRAAGIYEALQAGLEMLAGGERSPQAICREVHHRLESRGIRDIDYVELLNAQSLTPIQRAAGDVILAAAARVGKTRLIDNVVMRVGSGDVVEEIPLF
ncbi:MAG: pantoate--beta-alanine ligase [Candidatus Krumholzibacteria bacterium]|nr:pantoate--beta-alanine ligase [Candidatus Krumholzibacteria bacterium]